MIHSLMHSKFFVNAKVAYQWKVYLGGNMQCSAAGSKLSIYWIYKLKVSAQCRPNLLNNRRFTAWCIANVENYNCSSKRWFTA